MLSSIIIAAVLAADPPKQDEYTPKARAERIERVGEGYRMRGDEKGYNDSVASATCIRERVMKDTNKDRANSRALEVENAFKAGAALPSFCK